MNSKFPFREEVHLQGQFLMASPVHIYPFAIVFIEKSQIIITKFFFSIGKEQTRMFKQFRMACVVKGIDHNTAETPIPSVWINWCLVSISKKNRRLQMIPLKKQNNISKINLSWSPIQSPIKVRFCHNSKQMNIFLKLKIAQKLKDQRLVRARSLSLAGQGSLQNHQNSNFLFQERKMFVRLEL